MLKRKHFALGFLAFCLTATLLVGVTSSAEYDPWVDGNDDGIIDIVDIVNLAIRFGEEGTPINKTALLLELQDTVATLENNIAALNGLATDLQSTIEALESRLPERGNISVPASAFVPHSNQTQYAIDTRILNFDPVYDALFYGSVQLPDGAIITNVTAYWKDSSSAGDLFLSLERYNQTEEYGQTITVFDSYPLGNSGYGYCYADYIFSDRAIIDNSKYAYQLGLQMPPSGTGPDYACLFQYAIIEYEYPA